MGAFSLASRFYPIHTHITRAHFILPHTHMNTHAHSYIQEHTHTYSNTHVHSYIQEHTRIQTDTYTNVHTNIYTHTIKFIHTRTHICIYIYTHSYRHAYKYHRILGTRDQKRDQILIDLLFVYTSNAGVVVIVIAQILESALSNIYGNSAQYHVVDNSVTRDILKYHVVIQSTT